MKKGILRGIFSILISFCICIAMTGCDWPWSKTDEPPIEPSVWTIQYTDDEGTHQLKVEEGMPFSIENIPAREGYDFLGLFDAEVGGTQYVSAKGASLSIYTDKRNLVLFPQWQAKKYTLQLNYGNAPDAGIDRVEVSYDGEIQGLPEDFYIEGSEFIGWYNTQDASGTKFANGTVMNKSLAALADENNYIALYAVLDTAQYTVRFYSYDGNSLIEEKRVAHGSDITEVAPQTLSDGSEITSWSTSKNGYGNEYRGEITTDMDFYVRDFRYVLTLDYGYGNQKDVIRVNRGGSCTLPDISRERYIFDGWYENGTRVNKQYTPERSATLTARWTANFYTVSFNTNGGSSISAREVERGETIDLPSASREGYIFNYWKTSSGTRVSSPYKPTGDITLYADWTADGDVENFMGGNGTAEKPYRIKTTQHFANIKLHPDAYFVLTANIDLSEIAYTPLATFSGNLNGGGHSISNVKVRVEAADSSVSAGLFGTNKGTIKNLTIRNSQFVASPSFKNTNINVYCGSIAGINQGTIESCYVYDTTVIANSSDLADKFKNKYSEDPRDIVLGSKNWKAWISQSFDVGTSKWTRNLLMCVYSGGIAGSNSGRISSCSFSGNVEANLYNMQVDAQDKVQTCLAGGIAGYNSSAVEQATVNADVRAWIELDDDAGGMGWVGDTYPKALCYACGLVGKNASGTVNGQANGTQKANYRIYAPQYAFLQGASYTSSTKGHNNNLTIGTSSTYR